jgi:hypothetical protein
MSLAPANEKKGNQSSLLNKSGLVADENVAECKNQIFCHRPFTVYRYFRTFIQFATEHATMYSA